MQTPWHKEIIFQPIPTQDNLRIENVHNFLKEHLQSF